MLKADGSDVAIVQVAIKDAKGRVVPTAGNLVQFSIEGREESLAQATGTQQS